MSTLRCPWMRLRGSTTTQMSSLLKTRALISKTVVTKTQKLLYTSRKPLRRKIKMATRAARSAKRWRSTWRPTTPELPNSEQNRLLKRSLPLLQALLIRSLEVPKPFSLSRMLMKTPLKRNPRNESYCDNKWSDDRAFFWARAEKSPSLHLNSNPNWCDLPKAFAWFSDFDLH